MNIYTLKDRNDLFIIITPKTRSMDDQDYIIVGGGVAGCTLAAYLFQKDPSLKICIIDRSTIELPGTIAHLASHMPIETNEVLFTTPRWMLDYRLSLQVLQHLHEGDPSTHYGFCTCGNDADYDLWGKLVGDTGWSSKDLLPYLKIVENKSYRDEVSSQRGFDSSTHTASIPSSIFYSQYSLQKILRAAWARCDVQQRDDFPHLKKSLDPLGDNRTEDMSYFPGIQGINKIKSLVNRVILRDCKGKRVARAVELADGRCIKALKEIILSAGAYDTPQVLMRSGIGQSGELKQLGIPCFVDNAEVGENLHHHLAFCQWWKLLDPPGNGLPKDWIVSEQAPKEKLARALTIDGEKVSDQHPILMDGVCHTETIISHAPADSDIHVQGVEGPMDGRYIATAVVNLLPTSRGNVSLREKSPRGTPRIIHNSLTTEVDRVVMRAAYRQLRKVFRLLNTLERPANEGGKATFCQETICVQE